MALSFLSFLSLVMTKIVPRAVSWPDPPADAGSMSDPSPDAGQSGQSAQISSLNLRCARLSEVSLLAWITLTISTALESKDSRPGQSLDSFPQACTEVRGRKKYCPHLMVQRMHQDKQSIHTLRVLSVLRSRDSRESGKKKCRRPKLSRSFLQTSLANALMAPG